MGPADHAALYRTEAKMLCPVYCSYNVFVRGNRLTFSDTTSRLKPGFPSSPAPGKECGVSSAKLYTKRPTTYLREHYIPPQPSISALPRDQDEIVECLESVSAHSKPFSDDLIVESGCYFESEGTVCMDDGEANFTGRYQPIEEPWLLQPYEPSHYAAENLTDRSRSSEFLPGDYADNFGFSTDSSLEPDVMLHQVNIDSSTSWFLPERDHPVEDPWLLYPFLEGSEITAMSAAGAPAISEPTEDEQKLFSLKEQQPGSSDKLVSGSKLLSDKDSVSTEILINSSICTLQRIAILEDGNLVELLLEPVKTNVKCDSVYLGTVTKLVPHMAGAFVNIGTTRQSLMEINYSREPFIFTPFDCVAKEIDVNGSPSSGENFFDKFNEFLDETDDALSDDDAEIDFEDNDTEAHESEYYLKVEEVHKKTFTSCEVNDDTGASVDGSATEFNGNGNHVKVQSDSQLSHVGRKKNANNLHGAKHTWGQVRKGTKIVVQVVKEGLGTKGPTVTPYPMLRSRFWILRSRSKTVGVSRKISGVEHTRLKLIAKSLQPSGFGVIVRTVAAGHSVEELQKDMEGLLATWKNIMEDAKSAALAAEEGVEGAVPIILHQAMGQTLSVVQDYFNGKVRRMVVDSPRTYHEVTNYLQDFAPDLCDRVELHKKRIPLFDEFNIEEEINNILNKRVALPNGGSLVIEQTEALVSIDVNGGHGMFGEGASPEKANLDVNLAAAKQIARELRLRDIGGIIVVDFIDMMDDSNKRLVYEEVKKAVEKDRSTVTVSELSKLGLMELTRKRVRPSVTFMITEPCTCCHGTGRVEALETSFSKIEHEICGLLATMDQKADPGNPNSWPRLILRVDRYMCDYLTSGKKTRLATLSSSLKVWILLKVDRSFTRGAFEVKLHADQKTNNMLPQVDPTILQQAEAQAPISTKRTKLLPVKNRNARRK